MDHMGGAAVEIRPLVEADLPAAGTLFRLAFGTFLGMADPAEFAGDADLTTTRWRGAAVGVAAVRDGALIGTSYVSRWGSVGVVGPVTVQPDCWDTGVGKLLMAATAEQLDAWGVRFGALFTFAHSTKHVGLYQRFGFWPQHLTAMMGRPVTAVASAPVLLSAAADRTTALAGARGVADSIYDGLDLTTEIDSAERQGLGETVLVPDADHIAGFAVCHLGAGSEAGSGGCEVKFAAVRPGAAAAETFARLLDAVEALAAARGAERVQLGVNTACRPAYELALRRGYRAGMQGVAMTRPGGPGYHRPEAFVLGDWR